ncbi:FGFR1 oncogene partner [Armadillidium nasatum]|uniref:FGFR1 oncogene partner n=1 Tax=Armadillidium nasatum TaxID=96803 RepID=A0A5N5SZJ3_9CRUS|nr:FGFR1 oncogene partner [Armadillidium nasatum]
MSSISDDDDSGPSLKEMVTKNLEANGILGKLQAQLRASVFLILEEEFQEKNIPIVNQKTNQLLSTSLGKVAISLVQDFLQCLNLEFTLSVFSPETKSVVTENSVNREYLNKELGCKPSDNYPYLLQLIEDTQNAQNKNIKIDSFASSKETLKSLTKDEKKQEVNQVDAVLSKNLTEIKSSESIDTIDITKKDDSSYVKEKFSDNKESSKKGLSLGSNNTTNPSNHTITSSNSNQSTNNNTLSSISNNDQESEASDKSTLTKSSETEKSVLSGTEKYSEEEFSSGSETKSQTEEESSSLKEKSKTIKSPSKTEEEKSEIEEAVETAEDIEEDISSLDDLLSVNSESSNKTKDISASKEDNTIADYQESL